MLLGHPLPQALCPLQGVDTPPPSPSLALPSHLSTHLLGDTPITWFYVGAWCGVDAGEREVLLRWSLRGLGSPSPGPASGRLSVLRTMCDRGRTEWLQH